MALELAWTGSVNILNSITFNINGGYEGACANQLYLIKQAVKAAGWTVVSSSNGVSVSNTDLWIGGNTNVIKYQKYNSSAHSWIVLKPNNVSDRYLTIDYTTTRSTIMNNTPSTTTFFPNKAVFSFSSAISSGTVSASPSVNSNGLLLTFYDDVKNNLPATNVTHRVNVSYTTAIGEVAPGVPRTPGLIISEAQTGKNKLSFVFGIVPSLNYSNETEYAFGFDSYEGLTWIGYPPNINSTNSKTNLPSVYTVGGKTYLGSDSLMAGYAFNNSYTYGVAPVYVDMYSGVVKNPLKTEGFDASQSYSELPILVYSEVDGKPMYAARLADVTWTNSLMTEGSVTPPKVTSSSVYEKIKVDGLWIPWGSSAAPIL
jgi:hypothetical protein